MSETSSRRWLMRSLPLAAVLLLAGCATSPVTGVLRSPALPPGAAVAPPAATPSAANCRFQVAGIEDLRGEKSLGHIGPRAVDGQDFPGWFSDGLAQVPGYSADAAPIQLHLQVLKAYIQTQGSLKTTNIVVRVRIESPGRAAYKRDYRGVDDSMNWANGEGEVQEAFDRALTNFTQQLRVDLASACGS